MRVYDPIDMKLSPELSNEERAYEIFKRCWINQHIDDITMTQTEALYENDESNKNFHECEDTIDGMSFDEYVEEYGFANGEIYPCYEEFLDNDFENFLYYPEIEKIIDNTDEEESGISKIICYRYRLSQVLGREYIDFPSAFSDNKLLIETLKKLKVDKISFGNYGNTVVDEYQKIKIKKNNLIPAAKVKQQGRRYIMTNKNYMVTYTKEGNKNFCCVLVEAINEKLAEKTFKVFKPDCEFIGVREESNPETYIERGMSVLNNELFNSIVAKMDKITLDDEVNSDSFVMIAKVKNQRELGALKLDCSVEDATLLQEPLPDFPFFVTLDWDCMDYTVRAVETIDSIIKNDPNSDVAYLYRSSKNRVNDIQKLIFGDKYFDFEDKLIQLIDAFSDEPKAQEQIINRLAYELHYGNVKGVLSKHSRIRFTKEDVLEDKVLIDAYKKYYPENEYSFGVKSWRNKCSRSCSESDRVDYHNLDNAFKYAFGLFKYDDESVEVIAIDNDNHNEYSILYLGPDDIADNDYGFGSVVVAELQDIETMKREGYLPEDY